MVIVVGTAGLSTGIARLSNSSPVCACLGARPRAGKCRQLTLPQRLPARPRSVTGVKGWTPLHCDGMRITGPAAMHVWALWAGAAAAIWILYKLVRFIK